MGFHLFPLIINASLRSSIFLPKPFTAYVYKSVKSYNQASKETHIRESAEEKAPSTAQEFKKIAEAKLREAEQGVASQTADKAKYTMEATLEDSKLDSVKRRLEEHDDGADYRRIGDDQEPEGRVKVFSNKA